MKKTTKTTEATPASALPGSAAELDVRSQTALFSAAMKSFSSGDYAQAVEQFDRASHGSQLSVNESAKMYARMCRQRLSAGAVDLHSSEEHYNYAVTLLNARRYADARQHLETAVATDPLPHYLYALALSHGLLGSIGDAAQVLRRAVDADPALRSVARRDADFAPLLQYAEIKEIIAGEPAPSL